MHFSYSRAFYTSDTLPSPKIIFPKSHLKFILPSHQSSHVVAFQSKILCAFASSIPAPRKVYLNSLGFIFFILLDDLFTRKPQNRLLCKVKKAKRSL
jgi:hypothetical protein